MDTSKEFIDMCRKAVEVQELWKFREGDYYFDCEDPTYEDGGRISILIDTIFSSAVIKTIRDEGSVWLPRQDQLQEMVDLKSWSINIRWDLHEACYKLDVLCVADLTRRYFIDGFSMEQLLFSFVMHELHSKVWGNGEWITVTQKQAKEGGGWTQVKNI